MPQPNLRSKFISYELSPDEQLAGAVLPDLAEKVIQNLIADIAELKISLTVSRKDYDEYWQQEASLSGQIDILSQLLESSEGAKLEISERRGTIPEPDQQGNFLGAGQSPFASPETPFDSLTDFPSDPSN